jgi:mannose-6-phosphate isomerase-like protein (cupin superfamily)
MEEILTRTIGIAEMNKYVARFHGLKGSEEAFVDSRLPGSRRKKINLIGMGVVERTDMPELLPNIALGAHGFNLGMIQCDPGNGTKLHAHTTEEVFMPLIGPWAVTFMSDEGEQEIVLQPFDCVHVPTGVYRGFRYVGEGKGTLLTLIGGPDCGKVQWYPGVLEAAEATGLARDAAGNLR